MLAKSLHLTSVTEGINYPTLFTMHMSQKLVVRSIRLNPDVAKELDGFLEKKSFNQFALELIEEYLRNTRRVKEYEERKLRDPTYGTHDIKLPDITPRLIRRIYAEEDNVDFDIGVEPDRDVLYGEVTEGSFHYLIDRGILNKDGTACE